MIRHFKIVNPEDSTSKLLELNELDLQNSEGCFESIRIRADGQIPLWPWHAARLKNTVNAYSSHLDSSFVDLLPQLIMSARVKKDGAMRLRLSVVFESKEAPRIYLSFQAAEVAFCAEMLLSAISYKSQLKNQGSLGSFKQLDRNLYDKSLLFAAANGADEALIFNERLEPIESSRFNFFIRTGNCWISPKPEQGQIKGVMSTFLIESDMLPGYKEEVLSMDDLYQADEILMSNAFRGLVPLKRLDERTYSTKAGSALQKQIREIWQLLP